MQLTIIFYPNLRVVKSLQEKISWNLEYHAKRPWNLNHSLIVNFLIKIIKINKKEIKHRSCDYANLGTQVEHSDVRVRVTSSTIIFPGANGDTITRPQTNRIREIKQTIKPLTETVV